MEDWLVDLPQHMAKGLEWLNTEIVLGNLRVTPLAIFGASFGAVLAVIVVLKIKSLIF